MCYIVHNFVTVRKDEVVLKDLRRIVEDNKFYPKSA